MSKIALSPNALGSGTLTIAAPNTNSDRTIDLPDAAGTVFVSGQAVTATTGNFSGNVTLGSSVLATPTGSAPSFMCRAFVNFDGTGTPAIRASGNVSSITDNGTGDYNINFTTAMPDANYALVGTTSNTKNVNRVMGVDLAFTPTTTSIRVNTFATSSSLSTDEVFNSVAIFR